MMQPVKEYDVEYFQKAAEEDIRLRVGELLKALGFLSPSSDRNLMLNVGEYVLQRDAGEVGWTVTRTAEGLQLPLLSKLKQGDRISQSELVLIVDEYTLIPHIEDVRAIIPGAMLNEQDDSVTLGIPTMMDVVVEQFGRVKEKLIQNLPGAQPVTANDCDRFKAQLKWMKIVLRSIMKQIVSRYAPSHAVEHLMHSGIGLLMGLSNLTGRIAAFKNIIGALCQRREFYLSEVIPYEYSGLSLAAPELFQSDVEEFYYQ
jgi:hypothetical protein